jgi:glycosyltransferase involved in cell wall biosynthesis
MSSGLVAVTSNVAAIPEFVNDQNGILTPYEDYKEMAKSIVKLYKNPQIFSDLSKNAAHSIRENRSSDIVINKELSLIANNCK